MPIQLSCSNQSRIISTDVITIGLDPRVSFPIPGNPDVSFQHAVIRFVKGRWIVESLAESQLRIGSGRLVQTAWLNAGDVIHLTDQGPEVHFQILETSLASQEVTSEKPVNLPENALQDDI